MDRWAPLFNRIVESSVWDEDDMICKVWITLLAVQDSDHVVRKNLYQLGRACRKSEEQVKRALDVLSAPDERRKEEQEFEGRRIGKVEDGWLILNGRAYEELMRKVSRQVYQAKWAREHRGNKRALTAGEVAYGKAVGDGEAGEVKRLEEEQNADLEGEGSR